MTHISPFYYFNAERCPRDSHTLTFTVQAKDCALARAPARARERERRRESARVRRMEEGLAGGAARGREMEWERGGGR
jgi:hypothetical protein